MKFLNLNKVLCISPHPDDVEVGMMGSVIKHKDTHFDILCLTKGGAKGFHDFVTRLRQLAHDLLVHCRIH